MSAVPLLYVYLHEHFFAIISQSRRRRTIAQTHFLYLSLENGTVLLKSSSVRVTSSLHVPGHCHSVLADKMIMTTSCEIFHTSQNLSGVPQFQIVAIIHVHPLLLICNYIVNKVPVLINISHVHTHLSPRPYMAR